jgi:hypothetical protein
MNHKFFAKRNYQRFDFITRFQHSNIKGSQAGHFSKAVWHNITSCATNDCFGANIPSIHR